VLTGEKETEGPEGLFYFKGCIPGDTDFARRGHFARANFGPVFKRAFWCAIWPMAKGNFARVLFVCFQEGFFVCKVSKGKGQFCKGKFPRAIVVCCQEGFLVCNVTNGKGHILCS
jgi:hypothetical protein